MQCMPVVRLCPLKHGGMNDAEIRKTKKAVSMGDALSGEIKHSYNVEHDFAPQ